MAQSDYYVAIDQGGHASRALLFDEKGDVIARGAREVGETRPRSGWVEQDPEEIVRSIRETLADALGSVPPTERPLPAGLATQRSSIVCWDRRTGEPLSPVLSWQDRRARDWLDDLAPDPAMIRERTGLYPTAHYGASKLRWCLEHLPEVAEARERGHLSCGPLASFLIFRLLDERPLRIDPANAARTLLWNLRGGDWDAELLDLFGIPAELLPVCSSTRHPFGTTTVGETALSLQVLTGDQSAAIFGGGRPEESTAYVNLGTGAFIQRVSRRDPGLSEGLLTSMVLRDGDDVVFVVEGTVNGAASALRRVAGETGLESYREDLHHWLDRVEDPPLFLNGISGLGSPWWVPDFRSRFVGSGEPPEKMVAAVESVAFLLTVNLSLMADHAPGLDRVVVTGGLSGYDGLCRRLADLTGSVVDRPAEYEATARGTAFIVAGCPDDWCEPGEATRFTPGRTLR